MSIWKKAQQKTCCALTFLLVWFAACKQNKSAQQQKSHSYNNPSAYLVIHSDLFTWRNRQTHTSYFILIVILTYGLPYVNDSLSFLCLIILPPGDQTLQDSFTTGRYIIKQLPLSNSLIHVIFPPCFSTILFTMESPSPLPDVPDGVLASDTI